MTGGDEPVQPPRCEVELRPPPWAAAGGHEDDSGFTVVENPGGMLLPGPP